MHFHKAGNDCHEEKGREGEPGVGEEHAEELVQKIADDAH